MMQDLEVRYKKNLRRQIMIVILILVGFYAINFVSSAVVFLLSGVATALLQTIAASSAQTPIDISDLIANLLVNNQQNVVGLVSIVGIITGACIMFVLRGKRLLTTDLTHVNEPIDGMVFLKLILLMLGVQAALTFVSMPLEWLTQILGGSLTGEYSNSMGALMTPLGVFYIVLIGPIFEEIMFRGAIMRSLERYGINFALVISSLLFGIYHIFLFQAGFAFLIGLLLAYVAQRFSLKWSILLHIITNGFSMLLTLIPQEGTLMIVGNLSVMFLYALALVGSILLLILQRQALKAELATRIPASMLFVLGVRPMSQALAEPVVLDFDTGVIPPWPSANEPKPRPFQIAFSSPWMIAVLVIVFVLSMTIIFPVGDALQSLLPAQ